MGDTMVSCTALDADMAQASCGFVIRVRASQILSRTRFVAFGDSITVGIVRVAPLVWVERPDAYTARLREILRSRYPAQDILVVNEGYSGEEAREGVRRLPGVLDAERPEVLLLLEGVNNIARLSPSSVANDLRSMVSMAKARGIDVLIATLTPVGPPYTNSRPRAADNVENLNDRIRIIAAENGLGDPVDLHALFEADMTLLGADGLHPTPLGYTRMAELFSEVIVQRYGQVQSVLAPSLRRTRAGPGASGR
jgi:lysophospholipase L1-like esterase